MKRKIEDKLLMWKNSPKRMPLILNGARQVGKTYSLKLFGSQHYKNVVHINLEANFRAREAFDTDLVATNIIERLQAIVGQKIERHDTLLILANGMAENPEITCEGKDYDDFLAALNTLNTQIARKIASDGEGATRLIECNISGATDVPTARRLAKSVISSSLVKAAFFGKDANWGRILCALGYSGEFFTPEKTSVSFESNFDGGKSIMVFEKGVPLDFDEDLAKKILSEDEVKIQVQMEDGNAAGTAWGCDLTYDYVKINGDYRT